MRAIPSGRPFLLGPAWTYPCALLTFYSSVTIAGITASDLNPLKSELITLLVNVQTVWYPDRLVETGVYGITVQGGASRALRTLQGADRG